MKSRPHNIGNNDTLHNQTTDPQLRSVTAPIPAIYLPRESRSQRFWHGVGRFFAALVRKINQLLGFALVVLLLLLFARFILNFFGVTTSLFANWVFLITGPIVYPFNNLVPALPYNGYSIDVTTLIAIALWAITVMIVRQFLRVLVGRA